MTKFRFKSIQIVCHRAAQKIRKKMRIKLIKGRKRRPCGKYLMITFGLKTTIISTYVSIMNIVLPNIWTVPRSPPGSYWSGHYSSWSCCLSSLSRFPLKGPSAGSIWLIGASIWLSSLPFWTCFAHSNPEDVFWIIIQLSSRPHKSLFSKMKTLLSPLQKLSKACLKIR